MTTGLIKCCRKKSKLYKLYRTNNTSENKKKYIKYRNKLKTVLQKAEKSYYFEKFQLMSGNLKQTWKLIGSVLNNNKRSTLCELFIIDGVKVDDKQIIVNKFNEYFANIGNKLAQSITAASKSSFELFKIVIIASKFNGLMFYRSQ